MLLELAQNADDAGASEIRFLLDTASYPTNSVLGAPSYASYAANIATRVPFSFNAASSS